MPYTDISNHYSRGIGGLEGLILGIMKWCGCPSSRDADGVIDSRIAG